MNYNDYYEYKYLKYKNKYIELKNIIGGTRGRSIGSVAKIVNVAKKKIKNNLNLV